MDIVVIDAYKDYPQKEIALQTMADVEYVLLETLEDALLEGIAWNNIYMSDSLLVTYNSDGTVFVFDRKGKFFILFNH